MKFVGYDANAKELKAFDPAVAPADVAGVYYCIAGSESTTQYHLVPVGITEIAKSTETEIDTGQTTTSGYTVSRTYSLPVPTNMIVAGKIIVVGKSEGYIAVSGDTGNSYRINIDTLKNGTSITGSKVTGTTRTPAGDNTSGNPATFTEILGQKIPSTTFYADSGDTLDVKVEVEITETHSGIAATLLADPATAGNELVVHIQGT